MKPTFSIGYIDIRSLVDLCLTLWLRAGDGGADRVYSTESYSIVELLLEIAVIVVFRCSLMFLFDSSAIIYNSMHSKTRI